MSYDEAEFGQFCCYDFEESCDNTYHYSKMTGYVVNASNDGSVYGANVFTAKADEKLDKAGFMYVGKTGSADYTLSVYTDVSDSDPIGVLETQISGSVSANGFYTVDFPEDILLEEGEKYSISVKFSGDSGRGYLLAESDRTSKAQSGQSYVSLNGKYWSDVGAAREPARLSGPHHAEPLNKPLPAKPGAKALCGHGRAALGDGRLRTLASDGGADP